MDPATAPWQPSPRAALFVAIGAVSTGAVFVRLADSPPLVTAFWRCAIATAVLVVLFGRRSAAEWRQLSRADLAWIGGTGFALALHFAAWISSLSYTSVASSIVIVNTTPLWVALLAPLVTADRVGARAMFAISLSILGCVVIGAGDFEISGRALLGDALALAGAWMSALYMLAGRRLRQKLSLAPYVTSCYGVAAACLLAFALAAGDSLANYDAETFGWLACLALLPQLVGHSCYNYALRYLSATMTSVATLGESVGATLLAWAVLDDVPTPQTAAGGAIVLLGLWLAMRAEGR